MISQKLTLTPVKGLTFNDEGGKHIHLLNGKEVPGCTSISGLFQDTGWMFAWPVKLMEEKILSDFKDIKVTQNISEISQIEMEETLSDIEDVISYYDAIDIVKKHKNAWREKRDKSADTGTLGHKFIESIIKSGVSNILPILEDGEVKNIIKQFLDWELKVGPVWLASEIQVGSLTHSYAGILDALAEIDGKIVLVDFKTSTAIKPDYNIQLAGLCICLEEMGLKVDQRAILHLPKKGEYEYKPIDTDLEFEKKCFLAGLEHYRYKNMFLGKNEYKK